MTKDITGRVFNKLTVVKKAVNKTKYNTILWDCVCECGKTKQVTAPHLKQAQVKSCGCAHRKTRTTNEEFISKANIVHNSKFDYSKVDYQHSQTKITIICKLHGDFQQTPSVHLAGHGCKTCAKVPMGAFRKVTLEDFLRDAASIHGDRYDYSKVKVMEFKRLSDKLPIICKEHGEFSQMGTAHLAGINGCKKCRGLICDKDSFVERAKSIHGELYDYSNVNFVTTKTKVDIICQTHGVFSQTPHNHTAGKHGCPTCGSCGYDQKLPSSLYVMTDKNITKVGVTNRTAKDRLIGLRSNSNKDFSILKEYPNLDGKFCWDLETNLLAELSLKYKGVEEKFDGCTECFYDVDNIWLLNKIDEVMERI